MISMPEIKKGNNSANNVSRVTSFNLCKMAGHALHCTKFRGGEERLLFISACRLVMLYICAKFHEIISNCIKAIEWTQFL